MKGIKLAKFTRHNNIFQNQYNVFQNFNWCGRNTHIILVSESNYINHTLIYVVTIQTIVNINILLPSKMMSKTIDFKIAQ